MNVSRPSRAASRLLLVAFTLAALAVPALAEMPNFGPMRPYQIAFIRRGPQWTRERTPYTDSLQAGHMKNIGHMAEMGKLIAAGPFLDDQPLRGIYLFTADSAEAHRFAAEDPAVKAGRLVLDMHPILTRADIGAEYAARKKKNPAYQDSMVTMTFGLLVATGKEPNPKTHAALMEKHLWHLKQSMDQGQLRLAGPLLSNGPIRGILIFDGDTTQARKFASADPMVSGGWVRLELHPWMTADGVIPAK